MNILVFISLLAFSFGSKLSYSEKAAVPEFTFSWLDDKDTYVAGEIATIKIRALNNFDKLDKNAFKPTLTVDGKIGNSSTVSGVLSDFEGDPSSWKLFFTTMTAGLFNVLINEDHYKVFDSSLHFQVHPGNIYPSVCVASWLGFVHEFEAGGQARVQILPKDAFGNKINETTEDLRVHNFTVSVFHANDSIASVPNISHFGWNQFGYIIMKFTVVEAGDLLLHVEGGNQSLNGSPLPFKVNPGPLEVSNCVVKWDFEPNAWQLYSKMEIFIHQQDQYSNLVPGLYEFDAEVVETETNLSIPVPDLHFEEVAAGIQLFSFTNLEPGNFLLTISDMKHDKSISNMPYAYTVFVGYCNGTNSVVNGTGLNSSIAGERSEFSVYLNDAYQNPSPVGIERLEIQILREIDFYHVKSGIFPIQIINGSGPAQGIRYGTTNKIELAPSPSVTSINSTVGGVSTLATAFNVVYTPEKSGTYKILVFCGNIVLNGGQPFYKQVIAGSVDPLCSTVVKFSPKVARMINNEVVVQLGDSFFNPVLSHQSGLKLEIVSVNSSGFSSSLFVDNNDGSYTVHYMAKDVGTYEICASFDGKRISSCPFGVNVYNSEYFPKAENDTVAVWEDESIAFDVLANDYFAGNNASVIEFSKPGHGSLIEYGKLLRYTPYKDYYGNDSFVYIMSDINGNLATAPVNIFILTIPPQVVSFPSELQATEDEVNPKFGGFSGFMIRYSDMMENISVNLSAQSGTVYLSPMLMQFWEPIWNGLSVYKEDGGVNGLILQGSVEAINFALQSIQYYGNENFCGYDTIRLTTRNRNGVNDLHIPVLVEPINDPPFIHAPEFIILKSNEDESLIYDRETDKFEFYIGDPDLLAFPGNESLFLVIFSMEVNDGYLVTSLPAELITTVEVKIKNSYQWLPLQTYVTISKHFMVKAKGIRLHATVDECNTVMQQLFYHGGGEQDAILTVTLNDLGNYGCYCNCSEHISVPLLAEASLNLIRRRPMSSLVARGLGSAIVIESSIVFSLGAALIFFTCKCATILVNERRKRATSTPAGPASEHSLGKRTLTKSLSENATHVAASCSEVATHLTASCSTPLLGSQRPNFRQRSRRQSGNEESSKAAYKATGEHVHQNPAPSFQPFFVEKEQSEPV
ncbi:PREDICTED: protein GAMETE EXPRESSED 2-like [Fragaria vesca subsp. vesca]